MLSIEEIKLLIEKLKKLQGTDFQKMLDENLSVLEKLAESIDINNQQEIDRLDKTKEWYAKDLDFTYARKDQFDDMLTKKVEDKIKMFAKTGAQSILYNSLEIGPGYGRFSRFFLPWRLNYFLDLLPHCEEKIKKRFKPQQHKLIKFYTTNKTSCPEIDDNAVNFVFSWNTFTFFTQEHIKEYLNDINRVLLPGGYVFIHYTDCHYDFDLHESKRGYWNYNTKTAMKEMIEKAGYVTIEMDQFRPGANYAIFKKPGNKNPVLYSALELPAEK